MKIGLAADHAGFDLKNIVKEYLTAEGWDVEDFGAHVYDKNDDYPDCIAPLALAVREGKVDRGIAVCGSGVGASIVINKVPGVRGALITDTYSAHQGVEHDDMNVLCIGARVTGEALGLELVRAFLNAQFTNEERHVRRLHKLIKLEQTYTQH